MAELADAADSKSAAVRRGSSTLPLGTNNPDSMLGYPVLASI